MNPILRSWALLVLVMMSPAVVEAGTARPARPVRSMPVQGHAVAAARSAASARTLDDIHIEGEIPVPQVLFITARNQRRFLEFQHSRYLRSAQQLGEVTTIPNRVVVATQPVPPSPVTPAQESHR